jgi:hypothetical protein
VPIIRVLGFCTDENSCSNEKFGIEAKQHRKFDDKLVSAYRSGRTDRADN